MNLSVIETEAECNVLKNKVNSFFNNDIIIVRNVCYRRDGDFFYESSAPNKIEKMIENRTVYIQNNDKIIFKESQDFIIYDFSTDELTNRNLEDITDYIIGFAVNNNSIFSINNHDGKRNRLIRTDISASNPFIIDLDEYELQQTILTFGDNGAVSLANDDTDLFLVMLEGNDIDTLNICSYEPEKNYVVDAVWDDTVFFYSYNKRFENNYNYYWYQLSSGQLHHIESVDVENDNIRLMLVDTVYRIPWNYKNGEVDGDTITIQNIFSEDQEQISGFKQKGEYIDGFMISKDRLWVVLCNHADKTARVVRI